MIKNVVFDLGKVLIDYDPLGYLKEKGYDEKTAMFLFQNTFLDNMWNEMDLGTCNSFIEFAEHLSAKHPDAADLIRPFFRTNFLELNTLNLESEEFYNKICDRGYKVYILSNFSREGIENIKSRTNFLERADGQIISSAEHVMKPDERIYRILLERYHLIPEETVFFDDNKANIEAANNLSIHGILFFDAAQAEKDFEQLIQA